MKKWIVLLLGMSGVVKAESIPILHEMVINGLMGAPQLSASDLQLEINQEYLFVIENKFSQSLSFNYEKFGQHVTTRYLRGSSGVSQESFTILPNNKVIWHFTVLEPGDFSLYVVDPTMMRESNKVKLIVLSERQGEAKTAIHVVSKEEEKREEKEKTKKRSWKERFKGY